MTTTILALSGLSCGHCVKNVTQVLEKIDGVETVTVTKEFAKVVGDVDPQILIEAVKAEDYGAELAGEPSVYLALNGLSCGHCIKNMEKALSAVENAEIFDVSKTEAKIYGNVNVQAAIDAIVAAGYEASVKQ
ncbi:copper chaperone CopZ [Cricetibacter osteomyelitidis]|uniref:Copper chaperone CopZ n=1 Tax=Cricetibacter osteomyelitidis TaxID=1521931 RepID=A0A4V2T1F9_9PAST|nr:cation transporter [Cricetibacter osteomyelitidis]TCP93513.1 copper chaperone CopZ [Cricetibacter osteomyelitidis]